MWIFCILRSNAGVAAKPSSNAGQTPSTGAIGAIGQRMTKHLVAAPRCDLAVEQWAIEKLKPNPRNARTHNRKQCRALAKVIEDVGFINPIIIDADGMILAGHGRLEAAKLLGHKVVPVIRVSELSDAQKRAYVLADNRLAERAGWDQAALAAELGELSVLLPRLDLSIELTGFEI